MASYLDKYRQEVSSTNQQPSIDGGGIDVQPYSQIQGGSYLDRYRQMATAANVTPVVEPEPTLKDKVFGAAIGVGRFGKQVGTSAVGTLAQGGEFLANITRNIPRNVMSFRYPEISLDKDKVDLSEEQIQRLNKNLGQPEWVSNTVRNYEEAFDAAKGGGMEQLEKMDKGKIKPISDLLPTAIGQTFGGISNVLGGIQEGSDILYEQGQPDFMKDPEFVQEYSNMSTWQRIRKYPLETLRTMAPNIIGSGSVVIGSTLLSGGTSAGTFILGAATGEEVREDAVRNGVDPRKAETLGTAVAVPVMLLERLGFDTILGKGPLKDIGKTAMGRILKSAVTEAGTEATQEGVQLAFEESFKDVSGNDWKDRIAMAGLSGAFGGLVFGSAAEAVNNVTGKTATNNAEQKLNKVIDDSTKAEMIQKGLDYKPSENSVLKQSFVDQMTQDVKQQADLITDPKKKLQYQIEVSKLADKEYSTLRDFQIELTKIVPKKLDISVEKTAIGQEFSKAISMADESTQQYMAENAFDEKVGGARKPLQIPELSGGEAAPLQNILGDTLARIREERDKIVKEVGENPTPEAQVVLEGAEQMISTLQRQYNAQGGQEIIQRVKEEQSAEQPTEQTGTSEVPSTSAQLNIQTTPVTRPLQPIQSTGEIRTSKLAASVQANAVERKLADSLTTLPAYAQVNLKEQAQMAADIVKNDFEQAKRIAMGDEAAPDNVLPESVFTAVEQYAIDTNNADILRDLASTSTLSLEATAMGQRIRALGEREQYSPVAVMSSVQQRRAENAKQQKINVDKETKETVKEIKEEIKKAQPKPKDWNEFIDSLKC